MPSVVVAAIAVGSLFLHEITQQPADVMELCESDEATPSEADFFANEYEYVNSDAMVKHET